MILSKKVLEKEEQLIIKNANRIALSEVGKTSSSMNLDHRYKWVISNVDINAARDLGLTDIKKY